MSDLQATSVKRFQPLLFAGRLVSFLLFGFILCAGWIALSYCKNNLFFAQRNLITPNQSTASVTNKKTDNLLPIEMKGSNATARLVYLLPDDKKHFHTVKHLPVNGERLALNEEAAVDRGLKPCSVCFNQ